MSFDGDFVTTMVSITVMVLGLTVASTIGCINSNETNERRYGVQQRAYTECLKAGNGPLECKVVQ
jgi:hypothetical protein